ncbi:M56 family metallopeptidase [Undibacterium luofuense]|uniref:Peptidase M56 domain-containing protein n=1 Tax=Undibacterium luofuense TaxID=2828733 RepID=A0A941DPX3_9BURK|nr:M56 family metallopeptidase [Undibacterium luofuense]MBR7783649.1 hypothetical protein [Undibacterium luofuense]
MSTGFSMSVWLLTNATIALTFALFTVAILRRVLRPVFAPTGIYACWALLPLSLLSVFLPHKPTGVQMAEPATNLSSDSVATVLSQSATSMTLSDSTILWLWATGAICTLAFMVFAQYRYQRRLGKLTAHQAYWCASRTGISPALTGVLHPRIIVPADFTEHYNSSEQTLILAHEQQHLKHGDHWWNLLVLLLHTVFWFHPLLPMAKRWFRSDQEIACDAAVVGRHPQHTAAYIATMLKTTLQGQAVPLACTWQSHHPLKERVMRIQQARQHRYRRPLASILIATGFAACAALSWASQTTAPLTQAVADQTPSSGKVRYMISNTVVLNGNRYQPKIMLADGDTGSIRIEDKQSQWEIVMKVSAVPDSGNPGKVQASMVVNKDGKQVVKVPKLISSLNKTMTIEHSSDPKTDDVRIESLVAQAS